VSKISKNLQKRYKNGGKLLVCGNGGIKQLGISAAKRLFSKELTRTAVLQNGRRITAYNRKKHSGSGV
jgi:phosphoheptose isomerase